MSSEEKKVQPYEPFRFGWLERDSRPEGSPRNWWSGGTWTVPGDMIVETTVQEVEHAERCVNACRGLNPEAVPGLVEAAAALERILYEHRAHGYCTGPRAGTEVKAFRASLSAATKEVKA